MSAILGYRQQSAAPEATTARKPLCRLPTKVFERNPGCRRFQTAASEQVRREAQHQPVCY
jgi:hypothetical protein